MSPADRRRPCPRADPLTQPRLESVVDAALTAARRAGASYADVRIVRRRNELVATRDDVLVEVRNGESYGVGVRVLVDGAWGFAAASKVDAVDAAAAAERAVGIARANAKLVERRVTLANVGTYHATWSTELRVPIRSSCRSTSAWSFSCRCGATREPSRR